MKPRSYSHRELVAELKPRLQSAGLKLSDELIGQLASALMQRGPSIGYRRVNPYKRAAAALVKAIEAFLAAAPIRSRETTNHANALIKAAQACRSWREIDHLAHALMALVDCLRVGGEKLDDSLIGAQVALAMAHPPVARWTQMTLDRRYREARGGLIKVKSSDLVEDHEKIYGPPPAILGVDWDADWRVTFPVTMPKRRR